MVPGVEGVPALFARQEAAEGEAAGNALGEAHNVRRDAELLVAEQRPGATDARLDLVDEEQPVPLGAEVRHLADVVRVQGVHAALALDQLQHHGADVVPGDR